MIEGVVNSSYEAIIPLSLQGPVGVPQELEAVVDTGFNGYLSVPSSLVAELGLVFSITNSATLADGSEVSFDTYEATVQWEGQPRSIEVDEADTTPLVGMLMLDGHELSIQVRDGGGVRIEATT